MKIRLDPKTEGPKRDVVSLEGTHLGEVTCLLRARWLELADLRVLAVQDLMARDDQFRALIEEIDSLQADPLVAYHSDKAGQFGPEHRSQVARLKEVHSAIDAIIDSHPHLRGLKLAEEDARAAHSVNWDRNVGSNYREFCARPGEGSE